MGNVSADFDLRIAVLIPCYNEEHAIAQVVGDFQSVLPGAVVYAYDNNSRDDTRLRATEAGAVVRGESRQGKGFVVRRMFSDIEADVYVLTHEEREPWVQKGTTTFYFINDGIQSALEKAKQSAKGKDIRIQGGADTIQQYLNAGLVDEFFIHIAPVFLGSGIRLFDGIDKDKYDLQIADVIPSDLTTHLGYKLTKK